jgi:hypothetical protein
MAEKTPMSAQVVVPVERKGAKRQKLIERAAKGDRSCLPEIRALLTEDPEFLEDVGSPARWFQGIILKKLDKQHLLVGEAVRQKLDKLRSELEGPNPTPIERLLAERVCLCWFIMYYYETNYATAEDLLISQADYHQRKIDKAHARFLSALRTLAQVRKLALPALQVNIARNQVNVTQPSSSSLDVNGLNQLASGAGLVNHQLPSRGDRLDDVEGPATPP